MSDTFGPYRHVQDLAREPLMVDIAQLRVQTGTTNSLPTLEFGLRHHHLNLAIDTAGIELGAADRAIVQRLAQLPAPVVQVLIGLLSRANRRG